MNSKKGELIKIEVEFTEVVTKKVTTTTATLTITNFLYTVVYASGYSNIVPDTPFDFKLAVRKYDGTSVS